MGNSTFTPVVKKQLVMPVLKLEEGKSVYFQATGKIYVGKQIIQEGKAKEKPADLMAVTCLQTGDSMLLVVPAVVKSVLEDEYTDGKYVGLCFAVTKGAKAEGKRYFTYNVDEIENPKK